MFQFESAEWFGKSASQIELTIDEGGPIVLIAGVGEPALCFATVALISRMCGTTETMDEIEVREAAAAVKK
ncbi:hypothetical protein [Rhizobium sp.]|uniref:hypothetical protein n=1 Tax=Rhizobium sp. TaxID=391 RepID=UPI002AA8E4D3